MKPWSPNSYRKTLPKRCFLDPDGRRYPICGRNKKPTCQGLMAAYGRAATVAATSRNNSKSRALARKVKKKAAALRKKHGCKHKSDTYKGFSPRACGRRGAVVVEEDVVEEEVVEE